jgi:hypothetical protein
MQGSLPGVVPVVMGVCYSRILTAAQLQQLATTVQLGAYKGTIQCEGLIAGEHS